MTLLRVACRGCFGAAIFAIVLSSQATAAVSSNFVPAHSGALAFKFADDVRGFASERSRDVAFVRLASIRPQDVMGGLGVVPLRLLESVTSLGGEQLNSLPPEVLQCIVSLRPGCAPKKADASASSPDQTSAANFECVELCNLLGDGAVKPASERSAERSVIANLDPGQMVLDKPSQPETIDDIVDRMVRDHKAASVPRSTFTLRTVGFHVPKGQIVILTSERRLLYFFQDSIAHEFTIGVARRNLQRLGPTHVILKRRDPTWVPTALQHRVYRNLPGSVGPGPKNPLGTRALNLTIPMIRIHGTNDDNAIGEALSDGCFRMYNRDIEYLFEIVPVGTKVTILK